MFDGRSWQPKRMQIRNALYRMRGFVNFVILYV